MNANMIVDDNQDFVVIRFDGGIKPNQIDIKDLSEYLSEFHKTVLTSHEFQFSKSIPECKFSLVDIQDNCVSLKVSFCKAVLPVFLFTFSQIGSTTAPDHIKKFYQRNLAFCDKYNFNTSYIHNDDTIKTVLVEDYRPEEQHLLVKSKSVLYGELFEIGGIQEINAKVKTDRGKQVKCKLESENKKELASSLAALIFKKIEFQGYYMYDFDKRENKYFVITSFKKSCVTDFKTAFDSLKESYSSVAEKIDNPDEYINKLRGHDE